MCWINLSPLCVALTRQSSGFMADWICVIKDDKQNHLLVISICHRPAFAISRTSLKNNSESRREREKREREGGGPYAAMPQREEEEEGGGRWAKRPESEGVSVSKWGSMGGWREGQTQQEKGQMEISCCPSLSQLVDVALFCPQIVL